VTSDTQLAPVLGEHFDLHIPENSHPAVTLTVVDRTAPGTFTPEQLRNLVWSLRYQALFHYNRSPWVERDYSAPVADVKLIAPTGTPPAGSWHMELLDTSDQEGALGYHEDQAHTSKEGASGVHSTRGVALHPATGEAIPLAKVFCKTSREDGVQPSEVGSHEANEMYVDPLVMDESQIRKYLDAATKQWYIAEVGDPVQGRGYDVGAPEGRPCNVPEAVMADIAYPGWWGQLQTRLFTSACEEFALATPLAPFELAPGGYMSIAPEANPTEWTQIYGAAHAAGAAPVKDPDEPHTHDRKEPMSWSASVPATPTAEFDAAVDAAAVSPAGELAPEVTAQVTAARAAVKALVASGSFDANTPAFGASLTGHACVDGAPGVESISVYVSAQTPPVPVATETPAEAPAQTPVETPADAPAEPAAEPAAAEATTDTATTQAV
jgi:hypothetical protein